MNSLSWSVTNFPSKSLTVIQMRKKQEKLSQLQSLAKDSRFGRLEGTILFNRIILLHPSPYPFNANQNKRKDVIFKKKIN